MNIVFLKSKFRCNYRAIINKHANVIFNWNFLSLKHKFQYTQQQYKLVNYIQHYSDSCSLNVSVSSTVANSPFGDSTTVLTGTSPCASKYPSRISLVILGESWVTFKLLSMGCCHSLLTESLLPSSSSCLSV